MRHMAPRMGFAVIIARVTVTMWLLVFQFDRLDREVHNDSPKAKVPHGPGRALYNVAPQHEPIF